MALFGASIEYALHCLLWLAEPGAATASSRELADLQGVPAAYLAKIFPKLEKAGLVMASEGIRGGYRLARPPNRISVLDVVDAVEGRKTVFDCLEVRGRCALFEGRPPLWATDGVCGIHATMLRAERSMREELARTTLAALASGVRRKAPQEFPQQIQAWMAGRSDARETARLEAMRRPPGGSKRRSKT